MKRSVARLMSMSALGLPVGGCAPQARVEAPASGDLPARFTALGTEPFWAAEVDGWTLVYKTPDEQAGQRIAVSRRVTGARSELSGILGGKALVLTVTKGSCSDGMSDTAYSHIAELRIGAERLTGCVKLP